MEVVRAEEREPFVTRDGSTVREIAGPTPGNASHQSLAGATVPPGGEPLVVLCSCAPPYTHEDTVLCE